MEYNLKIEQYNMEALEQMLEFYTDYLKYDYKEATGEQPYSEWEFVKKIEKILKQHTIDYNKTLEEEKDTPGNLSIETIMKEGRY